MLAATPRPPRRGRPDSNRRPLAGQASALPLSYVPKEVGALVPSLPRRPVGRRSFDGAGGIRTRDLELMRLARTAAPPPRKSAWLESNQRSPAPEAGGVANLPYRQPISNTPGGTRTRSFRVEGPASSPVRPRGREAPAAGFEPASVAGNNRVPDQLGHAGTKGGRRGSREPAAKEMLSRGRCPRYAAQPRERTLKARGPTRFRDEVPRL
jgi:hypothetical protein